MLTFWYRYCKRCHMTVIDLVIAKRCHMSVIGSYCKMCHMAAYTTSPAAVMKLVIFFRSSNPPYNFGWSGVADGHCAIRSGWCLLHLWRTCSVVWSSSPQGHVGEGNIFSFLCMCALSLLWSERSRAKITWPGLSKRWYASFSCLDFSAVLMIVVFCW